MKKEVVTRAELETAIVETAWAFYHKGAKVQYCGRGLNEKFLKSHGGSHRPPLYSKIEDATEDYDLFTVCSDYCYSVYDNALQYPLLGGRMNYGTHAAWLHSGYPVDFAKIRWVSSAYNNGGYGEEDIENHLSMPLVSLEEMLAFLADYEKNLRPGDVLTFYMKAGGHNMMYLGNGYILDSCGKSYDMSAGMDKREVNGSVCRLRTIQDVFLNEPCTWDLRKYERNSTPAVFCVLRPLDLLVTKDDVLNPDYVLPAISGMPVNPNVRTSDFTITGATKTKMKYPGIELDRTGSRTIYGTTFTGDILTYTTKIANKSDSLDYDTWRSAYLKKTYNGEDYAEVLVRDAVPFGTELVSASAGASVDGCDITWNVHVPKGQTVSVWFSVRVTAQQGETIVSNDGWVDSAHCAGCSNRVGGIKLSAEKTEALAAFASAGVEKWNSNKEYKISAKASGLDFAMRVYNEAMAMDLKLPDVQELFEDLFCQKHFVMKSGYGLNHKNSLDTWAYTLRYEAASMVIPNYYGGLYVYSNRLEGKEGIKSFRSSYLEPGDIIVHGKLSPYSEAGERRTVVESNVIVYLGGGKYAALNTQGEMFCLDNEAALWKAFTYDFFVGLRPSQFYSDINAEVGAYDRTTTKNLTDADVNKAVDPWSPEGMIKGFKNITEESWSLARFPVSQKNLGLWVYSVAGIDLSEMLTQNVFSVLSHKEEKGLFAMTDGKYVLQDAPSDCLLWEKKMLLPDAWGGQKTCGGDPSAVSANEKFHIGDIIAMYEKTDGKDRFGTAVKINEDCFFLAAGITGVAQSFRCAFISFLELKEQLNETWDIYYVMRPSNARK